MAKSRDYLVWIDCEMTGLEPATDILLEIATIITDYDLNIIARGPELLVGVDPGRQLLDTREVRVGVAPRVGVRGADGLRGVGRSLGLLFGAAGARRHAGWRWHDGC